MDSWRPPSGFPHHPSGIAGVVPLHVGLVYALATGLARKVIDVVRPPVETRVIEEVHKRPPPPEFIAPPPPRFAAPPPPYIPPPEVRIAAPPPRSNTITAVVTTPPAPVAITPVPPPAPAPAPAPAPPRAVQAPVSAAVACANYSSVMGDAG